MKKRAPRFRSRLDPITDVLHPIVARRTAKLPGVILFAAVVSVLPLAYALDRVFDIGWLGAALGAVGVAAILTLGAFKFVRT